MPVDSPRHLPSSLRIVSIATFVYERVNIKLQRMCEKTHLSHSSWSTEQNWFVGTKCYQIKLALHTIKSFKFWETLPHSFWQVCDWYEFTRRDRLQFGRDTWISSYPFFARLNPSDSLVVLLDIRCPCWLNIILPKGRSLGHLGTLACSSTSIASSAWTLACRSPASSRRIQPNTFSRRAISH